MINTKPGPGQLIAGAGGVLLIVSLFLPWASVGGAQRSGWELLTMADVFLLTAGLVAIGTALTGGRIGVFRPDLSLNAAADLLALVAILLIAWLALFDFPAGADREIGLLLALGAVVTIAAGVGDYSPLRGAPWFPRLGSDERSASLRGLGR
jgi:hypothetical protein